jgi:hypothetical protein
MEVGGLFSPDSRWVGFGSNVSGQFRMYLAPVGRPGAVRPMTSFGAGSIPKWLDDGRIVYQASSGELPIAQGAEFREGRHRLGVATLAASRGQ